MRTPEAVACAVDPSRLCVKDTCSHFKELEQLALNLNNALGEAEEILLYDTDAAGNAAAEAILKADQELSRIDFSDCRPVRPMCN